MQKISIEQAIEQMIKSDSRYPADAYHFVRESLDFTIKQQKKKNQQATESHVSAQDLLEGLKNFALKEYGPLTYLLLQYWNIHSSEDVGNIVYNLVSIRVLKTCDTDSREDFKNGFDFKEAFLLPFEPSHPPAKSPTPRRHARQSKSE